MHIAFLKEDAKLSNKEIVSLIEHLKRIRRELAVAKQLSRHSD